MRLYGGIAQLARAFGSYPKCRRFKSTYRYHNGPVVKRLRHGPFTAVTRVRFPSGSPDKKRRRQGAFFISGDPTSPRPEGKYETGRKCGKKAAALPCFYFLENSGCGKKQTKVKGRYEETAPRRKPFFERCGMFTATFCAGSNEPAAGRLPQQ